MFSGSAVAIMIKMTKNIIALEMPAASKIFFLASFFHIRENFLLLFSVYICRLCE